MSSTELFKFLEDGVFLPAVFAPQLPPVVDGVFHDLGAVSGKLVVLPYVVDSAVLFSGARSNVIVVVGCLSDAEGRGSLLKPGRRGGWVVKSEHPREDAKPQP